MRNTQNTTENCGENSRVRPDSIVQVFANKTAFQKALTDAA